MTKDAKLVEIESKAEDLFVRGLAMKLTRTFFFHAYAFYLIIDGCHIRKA